MLRLVKERTARKDVPSLRPALDSWLALREGRRSPKTLECNRVEIKHLLKVFGDVPLNELHIGHFRLYQTERRKTAGASAINHELGTLSRLLREYDLWAPIQGRYEPLKETAWTVPKTFTMEEQRRLFKHLREDPKLELAEIVFTITRNTTASGCELRGLRLRHVALDEDPPRVTIPPEAAKNTARPRVIPLNAEAEDAFRQAVDRAHRLGAAYPEHYLFPFRVNRRLYDPRRTASKSWLRKQTVKIREATGIEHIRPHAFRHLAVTELLESGAPEQTVIALAGWVSRRMIETYSHSRIEAKADAVDRLRPSGSSIPRARSPRALLPAARSPATSENVTPSSNSIFWATSSSTR